MPVTRVDLSILQPFTAEQIEGYVSFLRRSGEVQVAEAVKTALEEEPSFMLKDDHRASQRIS